MRLPQALPLTFLLLACLEVADGRKGKGSSEKTEPPTPWAQSGQFSTRDQHICNWQLASGEEATELQLSCQPSGGGSSERNQCVYQGQPERCAAYSTKSRQYWKQILGKLRRKRHPCQDSSPLKSRLCSSKKGALEAQLRLVPPSPSPSPSPSPATPSATKGPAKGRSKGRGRAKEPQAPQKQPPHQTAESEASTILAKADAPEKRGKTGKRKGAPASSVPSPQLPREQPTQAAVGTEQPTELNADLAETYCEEKWHALCNFFVNVWNG